MLAAKDSSVSTAFDPTEGGPSDPSLAHHPLFAGFLAQTYFAHVGQSLVPDTPDASSAARWLYESAPFCLLVHNTAADPRFVYANLAAQACFERGWDDITRLPSRLTAEEPDQADRQRLIAIVTKAGFATGYRGLRIAKSGRRFWIENVTMWQLTSRAGPVLGQAAVYHEWRDVSDGER